MQMRNKSTSTSLVMDIIDAIEKKVTQSNQFKDAMQALESMLVFVDRKSIGMLMLGETGLGKSTLLDKFVNKHHHLLSEQILKGAEYPITPVPIIKFQMPEHPTVKYVCSDLLTAAGHTKPTGTEKELVSRIDTLIREQRVKILVIDECQHLLREHAGKRTTDVLNFIKNRMNKHHLVVIVAGIPTAEAAVQEHAELAERFSYQSFRLLPFSLVDKESLQNFGLFLKAFDQLFIDFEISAPSLCDKNMLRPIFLACGGSPRKFKYLLFKVVQRSLMSKGSITKDDFAKAYADKPYNDLLGSFNPFKSTSEKVIEKHEMWLTLKEQATNEQHKKPTTKSRRKVA
jgi:hypothetical protein